MQKKQFDVVVIGTGTGSFVANKSAAAGKKTAIIDNNPFGGECALRGCDPKKVLIGLTHLLSMNKQFKNKGIETLPKASWKDVMNFKNTFTGPIPSNHEAKFNKAGISTYHGKCHFLSPDTLEINGEILESEYFVIATGSKPGKLLIPGEDYLIDSTSFLDLQNLPKKVVMVGGGYIGFEFAHIAAQFGVEVTILHRGVLPLDSFEPDLVKLLIAVSEEQNIKILLNTEVTSISKTPEGFIIHALSNGSKISLETSLAIHTAGRAANVDHLHLEKANVKFNKKGVEVNDYMQSISNPAIYACGDANDRGLSLTPVGAKEAITVASNLLKGNHLKIEYGNVPSSVFTLPPLASVGFTEEEAIFKKLNFKVKFEETTEWYSSKRLNEPVSAFKVLIDQGTDQILGAHLLGNNAEENINIFAVAMNAGIKASQLKKTIFAYPTHASDIVYML